MSRYTVYVVPDEFRSIKHLPGYVRQRVSRAIDELADNPSPSYSKQLEVADMEDPAREVRRRRHFGNHGLAASSCGSTEIGQRR